MAEHLKCPSGLPLMQFVYRFVICLTSACLLVLAANFPWTHAQGLARRDEPTQQTVAPATNSVVEKNESQGIAGEYAEDSPRDLSRALVPVWWLVSLVFAGIFVVRSKRPVWIKTAGAVAIILFGPTVCHLIYASASDGDVRSCFIAIAVVVLFWLFLKSPSERKE
jgi:hypothetical protein